MSRITQIHHPDFSLWQSAIDQVVAKHKSAQTQDFGIHKAAAQRPDTSDSMVGAAATAAINLEQGVSLAQEAASAGGPKATEGVGEGAKYCASIWWEIAKARVAGDAALEQAWKARLGSFTSCDPRYADAVEQYVAFYKVKGDKAPYKVWTKLDDFIVDWQLPAKSRVVILGDWGTGQPEAKALLAAIARKNPDVILHLGDIYYAGTEFEMTNYFLSIWKAEIDMTKVKTFTLAGNHDMYSGGGPYYELLNDLGQPASYFCLRNDDWQFVALDTGLHDVDAVGGKPTFLEATEVEWLNDKIATAGNRQTVLLSHHQLYTAFEDIGGQFMNTTLNQQVGPILPKVTAWFWGHEHNQVIYKPFQGVLARCIGHGAYPVGITEISGKPKFPEVPLEPVTLAKGASFYSHGYVVMDLDGPSAMVSYYQDSDPEDHPMFTEKLGR
ncbi:MAG TPA: metallophosphoesterase [Bryobacteraceae bacterium]|nr:metallophosphoesterase [Bryobacteraceae bacterium]